MSRSLIYSTAVGLACFCLGSLARGGDVAGSSPVGRKVENFTLNDFYGKSHALADFKDKKAVVLAFLGTECPLARLYGPRLAELDQKYAAKGVQILGINSNRQDSITEIAAYGRTSNINFPILKDLNNKVADALGAVRTPEIFVLDGERVVRYHGRIDDQYGVGYLKKSVSEAYLPSAIESLLAGKSPAKSETGVVGCFIGRVHAPAASAKVTYSNQVVRLLNKRCVACHRQGEVAPFAMTNYEEVSGWADTIAEVVRNRRMPPWPANPQYGHFRNDVSLSEGEKEILYQWAAAGAPEGDRKDLPPAPKFVDGWQLPKEPDKVVYMSEKPFSVPAQGTVAYKYFTVDPGFTENKWIKAIEARPGNRAVVHHIIAFASPKGGGGGGGLGGGQQFLVGYAPGAVPMIAPPGMAKLFPAGYQLLFQIHYTPNGAPQTDRSKVGIVFADKSETNQVIRTVEAINQGFAIPPGADNYRVDADSFALGFDAEILQFMPHMHLRGKSFQYEVKYPNGKTEVLLDVPHYDFGWQLSYKLADLKKLPKGAVMHCTAHFDNSENNLNNPDPKSTVRWGDQTWEEMMIGFYDVVVPISKTEMEKGQVPDFNPGPEQIAKSLLDRFDKNHDGKITRDEIPSEPFQMRFLFTQLDRNKDGVITLDEIVATMKERRRGGGGGGFGRFGGRRPGQSPNSDKPADAKPSADSKSTKGAGEQKSGDQKETGAKDQRAAK
jgi:peroxiredoxin